MMYKKFEKINNNYLFFKMTTQEERNAKYTEKELDKLIEISTNLDRKEIDDEEIRWFVEMLKINNTNEELYKRTTKIIKNSEEHKDSWGELIYEPDNVHELRKNERRRMKFRIINHSKILSLVTDDV